jgi:tetratricopeptide (TPR) repeat protein
MDNLLQALAWCDHADDRRELGLRLAYALLGFWYHLGLIELGHQVTLAALGRAGAGARNRVRARALAGAGTLSRTLDRYDEANEQMVEALSIAREIGDNKLVVESLLVLGYLANDQGGPAAALERLGEALALARELGDKALAARALNGLGEVHRTVGNMEAAQPLYEESLALAREQGNVVIVTTVCDNLARVFISRSEPERAWDLGLEVDGAVRARRYRGALRGSDRLGVRGANARRVGNANQGHEVQARPPGRSVSRAVDGANARGAGRHGVPCGLRIRLCAVAGTGGCRGARVAAKSCSDAQRLEATEDERRSPTKEMKP